MIRFLAACRYVLVGSLSMRLGTLEHLYPSMAVAAAHALQHVSQPDNWSTPTIISAATSVAAAIRVVTMLFLASQSFLVRCVCFPHSP